MKILTGWRFRFALLMIGFSVLVYLLDYLAFGHFRDIATSFFESTASLFLYVLVVVLVIEEVLARQEKKSRIKKMNMVIGAFFSTIGRDLLTKFSAFIENAAGLRAELAFDAAWDGIAFRRAMKTAESFPFKVRVTPETLQDLRGRLAANRDFLLGLLENPTLLEHERFTDLLWAVFHLAEELEMRPESLESLPAADYTHLSADVRRAYSRLVGEWLAYARHLKENYPFLYSLAVRTNPFKESPTPVIED